MSAELHETTRNFLAYAWDLIDDHPTLDSFADLTANLRAYLGDTPPGADRAAIIQCLDTLRRELTEKARYAIVLAQLADEAGIAS